MLRRAGCLNVSEPARPCECYSGGGGAAASGGGGEVCPFSSISKRFD